ncbi:MAG: ABC transporter ATP-binding protein [Ilumatobacteraceae bacterium]
MNGSAPTGGSTRSVVHVDGLRVRYGETDVVDGISFDVHAGEVLALLGPNGAGKTTTVEVLEGHRRRTAGTVDVLGFDPQRGRRAFRERIGIVLQEAGLDGELTVHEALTVFGGLYPNPRDVDEILTIVDLEPKRNARVRTLSGGQRRRLDLALAIVGTSRRMSGRLSLALGNCSGWDRASSSMRRSPPSGTEGSPCPPRTRRLQTAMRFVACFRWLKP